MLLITRQTAIEDLQRQQKVITGDGLARLYSEQVNGGYVAVYQGKTRSHVFHHGLEC